MLVSATTPSRARRIALVGLFTNFTLAFVKLAAGYFGNSYALIADAVESLTDILGSAVIWGGLHVSSRPASSKHPYGYGKAESLAALVVALIVFLAGVGIAVEAIREIVTPHHLPARFTLVVLVAVVIVKETLFRIARRTARAEDSTAVETDAWHHRADAITSLAAFVGISAALTFDYAPADDWAALFGSAIIIFNALHLMKAPVRELLDATSDGLVAQSKQAAAEVEGVRLVHKVFARKSGTRYWIDMHIWVDGTMSVREAHALSHAVKDAVRTKVPSVQDVLIHIEPTAEMSASMPAAAGMLGEPEE